MIIALFKMEGAINAEKKIRFSIKYISIDYGITLP